jgi:hypothetical protein
MHDLDTDGAIPFASASVTFGNDTHFISVNVRDGIADITVVGEPEGKLIPACVRFAVTNHIMRLPMPTLVDLTRFNGSIDWQSIQAVAEMTNVWLPDDAPSPVAYVAPSALVALVVKLLAHIFPKSEHRLFHDRDQALAWLKPSSDPGAA